MLTCSEGVRVLWQ